MSELADRVQRVRLLLETLNDPYPTPRSALRSDSGPAASRYVPCEECRRLGWIKRRRRGYQVLCLTCNGVGWRRRVHGDAEWDAYLGLPVSEAVALPVEAPARRESVTEGEDSGYAWERLKASYERRGSYAELRTQLAVLALDVPRRYWLIRVVLVDGEVRQMSARDDLDLELGVVSIALRMRSIRVPPWLLQHEQRETNDAVRRLASDGLKPGQIAARLGVSPEHVKRVLRKQRQRENTALFGRYDHE